MTGPSLPPKLIRPWEWPALALLAVSLAGLGGYLADELIEGERFSIDSAILLGLRTPGDLSRPVGPGWLQQSAVDISALGGFTLMWLFGLTGVVWLLAVRKRAEAAWIAASMIGSAVIDAWLKNWVGRPRPALVPHLVQVETLSFPSGHAMVSAAVYLTLALMLAEGIERRAGRAALIAFAVTLVLLIGCSRVYLGVHWPSDVLAGWSFGAAWALAVFAGNRWLRARMARG